MAKRKITVTVDEALVERLRAGDEAMSAVVNDALATHFAREARHAALAELLTRRDEELGPVSPDAAADARAAFDEVDAVDAHVVAVCVRHGGGLVVTGDPDDVHRLADAVPDARIVTRAPAQR